MQRDLSMLQCIPLTLLERGGGDFGSLQDWADPENLEGWDLIEAKANILNKNFDTYTALLNHSSYMGCLLTCVQASKSG